MTELAFRIVDYGLNTSLHMACVGSPNQGGLARTGSNWQDDNAKSGSSQLWKFKNRSTVKTSRCCAR